ncbi:PAS and ANTAR domain-containing protein [Arthrobacter sp. ISL-28]|uniref:PAS and ANTAR domain-containing protein n=1 Tax=Arthrobacter sp. ISL-28 TaxID=2819108 RepID=UPI001BEB0DA1|nr:PAS and ANTAR domain-containing protein [Arthrobacter sp. ISL-28]MBT2521171.1 ANTAR domain-containing protein [Arthrobacter sp. ISL-28]
MEGAVLSRFDTYLFPLAEGQKRLAGTFGLDVASGTMEWSEELFAIHGFAPGEVVPTITLWMSHKHPDDREPIRKLLVGVLQTGGQAAVLHRVIDARGKHHQVLSSFDASPAGTGAVECVQGFMVDLTRSIHEEARQAADDALHGAFAHKSVIEQAKGIIMALRSVDAETAFELLSAESQHTNTKLHCIATALVSATAHGEAAGALALFKTAGAFEAGKDTTNPVCSEVTREPW